MIQITTQELVQLYTSLTTNYISLGKNDIKFSSPMGERLKESLEITWKELEKRIKNE